MKGFFRSACIVAVIVLGSIVTFGQNYKIKQTMSMSGQQISSTVYVKGSRKRSESGGMMGMGADVATIEQCDLGRTVQVNDKKKTYFIQAKAAAQPAPANEAARTAGSVSKPVKGGTITQTSSIIDTGERKQMFGVTARHIKTTMSMKSSPDACDKTDMGMETDGWYVDLPLFSCPMPMPNNPYTAGHPQKSGCQDTVVTKATGGGKVGFPLEMTQTMRSGGDETAFSQTISTVEFSKATLDDALFNVPSDYRLANSSQELYGRPDFSAMANSQSETASGNISSSVGSSIRDKKPGMIRVGVLMPTNRSGDPTISPAALQSYLAGQLSSGKVEGFAVSSEADAKANGCDYLLTSDISKLKQSTAGKIGGMFGGITGAPTAGKYDAQVDYRLVSLTDGRNALQSKSANKAETDASRAAESVLAMEALAVIAAAK